MNGCHKKLSETLHGDVRLRLERRLRERYGDMRGCPAERIPIRLRDILDHLSAHVVLAVNERLLLEECAVRLPDVRGRETGRESGPEYVKRLLLEDFDGTLSSAAIAFMSECLVSAPSMRGCRTGRGWLHRHRALPETLPQRALALADDGYFFDGWDSWFGYAVGCPDYFRDDPDGWIKEAGRFLDSETFPLLHSLKPSLDREYYDRSCAAFDAVRGRLSSLRKNGPDRERLQEILRSTA